MYKSRILDALKASNENLDEGQVVEQTEEEVVPAEVVAEPEEADIEVAEVVEAEQEVAETEGAIEEVEEVAEALESLQNLVQGYGEEGLNTQGAQFATFAAESLFNRIGLEDTGMPSLESFSGHSNRVRATTLSVESMGEKLKQLWEAIKNMLRSLKDKIIAFFKRIFVATERVQARAEKLREAAKKAKGSPKKATIALGSVANQIAVDGALESSIGAGMKDLVALMESSLRFDDEAAKKNAGALDAIKQAAENGSLDRVAAVSGDLTLPTIYSEKEEKDGVTTYSTKPLPGNVRFYIAQHEGDLFGKKYPTYKSGKTKSGKSVEKTEINTLSVADCTRVIGDVLSLLVVARKTAKAADAHLAESKKMLDGTKINLDAKAAESLVEKAKAAGEQVHGRAAINLALRAFQKAAAQQGRLASQIAGHSVEVANAYLTIAQKSLAQYGVVAKDEGAAPLQLTGGEAAE